MQQTSTTKPEEGITLFGQKPAQVLAAFHSSGLSAQGYSIAGRIVQQTARVIKSDGQESALFDGKKLYAGTFIRCPDAS